MSSSETRSEKTVVADFVPYNKIPWYSRVPFISTTPTPPLANIQDASLTPEAHASWVSILTFSWIYPLLAQGYARPLDPPDLYRLQPTRGADVYGARIIAAFERRRLAADQHNAGLDTRKTHPPWRLVLWWRLTGGRELKEQHWREVTARQTPSLVLALNDAVFWWLWLGGLFKLLADVALICSPLLVKAIIQFVTEAYNTVGTTVKPPPLARGIGLAIALLFLQIFTLFFNAHGFYRSFTTGVLLRTGLISALFSRALVISPRARAQKGISQGKLVAMISTDVSRVDFCMGYFHMAWTAPVQMLLCLGLLAGNLGYSALPGFAFFVVLTPVQGKITKQLFKLRKQSMIWTDKRVTLLQEVLGGIRLIKFFAWEIPFLQRIAEYRKHELEFLRSRLLLRSFNNAFAFSLPALAAVVSFVTYSLSGHPLEPAIIFSSLSLFQLLRTPLTFLPVALNSIADAGNAVTRIREVFLAETLDQALVVDSTLPVALRAQHASFTWDAPPPTQKDTKIAKTVTEKAPLNNREMFQLRDINLELPRGELTAIVGPVGSGKSSLLQGLIGEMRRTSGQVVFGGSVGYCPQTPWIQSASIRDNITFGRPFDPKKYWSVVHDACLLPDFDMLTPDGDLTEVGEKGISLSGGQKQRISIARALYFGSDITFFDDSFSALDAHVGNAVFQNVLQNSMAGTTRILVTHALHFLPRVDHILVMSGGTISESGSYQKLMANKGFFSSFLTEFGSKQKDEEVEEDIATTDGDADNAKTEAVAKRQGGSHKTGKAAVMQSEERNKGSVSNQAYGEYFRAANLPYILPLFILAVLVFQGASILSPYWLVWWQEDRFPLKQGVYMAIYAALAFGQALGLFFMGIVFALFTFYASLTLHRGAIKRIMHAPVQFYDTTPLGRIMNRLSKDVDTIDNVIGDAMRMFMGTLVQIVGTIVLVSIILPWFLLAVGALLLAYYWVGLFYRSSAREIKRLDAVLRSSLYAHFSESLSGLATIRAYGESHRFQGENEHRIDIENRAYWLTVTNQRWLSVRLDFLGSLLTFAVAILVVGTRFTISPAQTGVVLSYILVVQQAFGWMVRQSAEVENNMNGVERILHYANHIETEAAYEHVSSEPKTLHTWPSDGAIEFRNLVVQYRPELPPVLKDVSISVNGGEHVAIVGRTGAGKSTVLSALYRLIEPTAGEIIIDGVDISTLGLRELRSQIAIIPQDALLFSGTLRTNLDPFTVCDDATLWDALKRSRIVQDDSILDPEKASSGITLDSQINEEGSNLSVGQRSLVSLARALVKNSKIIVLDEATASVDYETDRHIQDLIETEFARRTLICIAHRLKSIIGYDRVCVMDAGNVVQCGTPAELYSIERGIFRTLCDQSGISLHDISLAMEQRESRRRV